MKKIVTLQLPPELHEEDVPDFVSTTVDSLYGALNIEIKNQDQLASVQDITVTSVTLSDDDIAVGYRVAAQVAAANRRASVDDARQGTSDRLIVGKRRGRSLIFDRFIPSAFRSKH